MSCTPKSEDVESLNDSWIDIQENMSYSPSDTPVHILTNNNQIKNNINGPTAQSLEKLQKLLLDAQKESGHSSLKGSFLGSSPITPDGLQTPPNSLYFNDHEQFSHLTSDWLWDWSHRYPLTKDWNRIQLNRNRARPGIRQWIIRRGILSKEVLSLLFLTNILSLILGAGIGCTIILRKAF